VSALIVQLATFKILLADPLAIPALLVPMPLPQAGAPVTIVLLVHLVRQDQRCARIVLMDLYPHRDKAPAPPAHLGRYQMSDIQLATIVMRAPIVELEHQPALTVLTDILLHLASHHARHALLVKYRTAPIRVASIATQARSPQLVDLPPAYLAQ